MRFRFTVMALLTLCLVTACEAQNSSAEKPQQSKAESAPKPGAAQQPAPDREEPSAAATTAKGTTANDPDYVIGPDDVLVINVWHEPEISRSVSVRPDGKISLPLIGDVEADGKTPKGLRLELNKKLATLLKDPEVTVIVQDIRSQKFNVLGEVNHAGVFPLNKPMTVLDAIALAGGFRDFAKPKKMYILRRHRDGSTTKIPVNYNDLIKGTLSDKNFELESRDTIVVP